MGSMKNKRVEPLKCKATASCTHVALSEKTDLFRVQSVLYFCVMLPVDHGEEVGKDNELLEDNSQPDSAVIGGLFYHLSLLHCFICNSQ